MTTIAQISDLHMDFWPKGEWERFVDSIAIQVADKAEILLICGDVVEARTTRKTVNTFKLFCDRFNTVLFVAGNHEYYKERPSHVERRLRAVEQECSNFKFLDCNTYTLPSGRKILGGTMWFPYEAILDAPTCYGGGDNSLRKRMNDFSQIKLFEPWVYDKNIKFVKFVNQNCNKGDIVVTHHAPHPIQITKHFAKSDLNVFYVCDMTETIVTKEPEYWFHGHIHTPMANTVHGCKIISNPFGYPFECKADYDIPVYSVD